MASELYNQGMFCLVSNTKSKWDNASHDFRIMLIDDDYTPDDTHTTVDDVLTVGGGDEFDGSGYVRKQLTTRTVTKNNTTDRVQLDADDVTWTSLGTGSEAPRYAIVYIEGANDAARELIGWIDLGAPISAPNGGDWSLIWDSTGIFRMKSP